MRADDLSSLMQPSGTPELGFRQGTVITWDATTGSNQISVGGTLLDDVPIMNTTEAYSISAGSIVGLLRVRSQYFILGRIAVPGQGGALAGFDSDAASASNSVVYNSNTSGFVSISGGPSISSIEVFTGRLLVMMTAHILVQDIARLYFGHELSGAGSVAAARSRSAFVRGRVATSTEANAMFAVMHTGLTPGTYTVAARAEAVDVQAIGGIDDIELGSRTLIAIPY